MGISTKWKVMRDIAMMVRKDCITLQPQDRILLDIGKDAGATKMYVGQVFYDFDSGNHCFKLYNEQGLLIIPKDGHRVLPGFLTAVQLRSLGDTLSRYVEESVNRARNISEIDRMLAGFNDESIYFTDGSKMPQIMVDYSFDGRLQGPFTVESVYRDPSNRDLLWLGTQGPDYGEVTNIRLGDVSDMGVSMVHEALSAQLNRLGIDKDRSVSEKRGVRLS